MERREDPTHFHHGIVIMNTALKIASGILLMPVVLALGLWAYLFQLYPRLSLPTGCGAKTDTFEVRCNDRAKTKVLYVNGLPYPTSLDENDFESQLLSGAWKWRFDEKEIGEQDDWHETQEADASWKDVTVPSTYNVPSSKYRRHQGVTWYMRRFVPSPWDPHDYYPRLSFRGVFLRYKIWLNGQLVGTREGAYTPAYFDVSRFLKPDQENIIVVRADNRLTFSSMPPKNRQDHKHGWGIWGGIYRDVLLEAVPRQNVFKVMVLPRLAGTNSSFSVTLGTHNHGRKKPYTLEATLLSPSGRTVHTKTIQHTPAADVAIHEYVAPVASPETYSPSTPRTYTLSIAFASGSIRQHAAVKPGMRSVDVISVNSYYGWYYGEVEDLSDDLDALHARYPDKPIILTEFGADAGLGRKDSDGVWQAHEPGETFAYGSYGKTLSERFQVDLYERYFEVVKARPYMVGITPWLLADFHGPSPWFERNLVPGYVMKGLVTKERVKKQGFYTLRGFYRTWRLPEEAPTKRDLGASADERGERSG